MTPDWNNVTLANTDNWGLAAGCVMPICSDLLSQGNSSGDIFPVLMIKEICLHQNLQREKQQRERRFASLLGL